MMSQVSAQAASASWKLFKQQEIGKACEDSSPSQQRPESLPHIESAQPNSSLGSKNQEARRINKHLKQFNQTQADVRQLNSSALKESKRITKPSFLGNNPMPDNQDPESNGRTRK